MDTALLVKQANSDGQLLSMWLDGRPASTQRKYAAVVSDFLATLGNPPLGSITLPDVQRYMAGTVHLSPATRARLLATVRSLLGYAVRVGYLPFNVAVPVIGVKVPNRLAERILEEPAVQRMLALETDARNHAILLAFYGSGMRVAELAGLCWRDVRERGEAGQLTIHGKGGKSRTVLLSRGVYRAIVALGSGAGDDPVFVSGKGGHLDVSQVRRIVLTAARRAGVPEHVSPHYLRHAHASHALDAGCPISLVQATLGHASIATTGKYLHARPTESSGRYLRV